MSAQFGKCNFDGRPVDPQDLNEVRPVLAPYGPDGEGYICKNNIGILYRAFHTTKESRSEVQPHVSESGLILTWDGRLDNRDELADEMSGDISSKSPDVEIVAAAYQRWGAIGFAKLIGDWAVSVWDPKDRSITLAKDFVGTRHLYYMVDQKQVTWCSILDPLLLFAGHSLVPEKEYLAGWLAFFPAPHLTPYKGVSAVPPSSFVRVTGTVKTISKYWDFDSLKRVRYPSDAEYEEHFRVAFAESVRRRLRSEKPVIAELSGGMDSSSIVCVADEVIALGKAGTPSLDTVSYYDNSEPAWNERPYFTSVEEKRDRTGWHIDVQFDEEAEDQCQTEEIEFAPFVEPARNPAIQFEECLLSHGNRVLLSGIGGDEVLGGVPTPTPELADLIATCQFRNFSRRLVTWSLNKRLPWFHLLFDTLADFLPDGMFAGPGQAQTPEWLRSEFAARHRTALCGYRHRLRFLGPLPSFQANLNALDALRRQLNCSPSPPRPLFEARYPFLDRSLLEFLYAIPPDQLVRPGQRRSLMRRALAGIVPKVILDRRRKAFVAHPHAGRR